LIARLCCALDGRRKAALPLTDRTCEGLLEATPLGAVTD
jgi:hypothetical protein